MTLQTALPGIIVMPFVADKTTQSFVHTPRRAIVAGARLMKGVGCVALRAEALQRVVGYIDGLIS